MLSGLKRKQAELDALMAQLATLEEKLLSTVSEKDRLEAEVNEGV